MYSLPGKILLPQAQWREWKSILLHPRSLKRAKAKEIAWKVGSDNGNIATQDVPCPRSMALILTPRPLVPGVFLLEIAEVPKHIRCPQLPQEHVRLSDSRQLTRHLHRSMYGSRGDAEGGGILTRARRGQAKPQ